MLRTQRSTTPFCEGLRMLVRIGFRALEFKTWRASLPNFESWSNKTYR
jgi:hypothetical protein